MREDGLTPVEVDGHAGGPRMWGTEALPTGTDICRHRTSTWGHVLVLTAGEGRIGLGLAGDLAGVFPSVCVDLVFVDQGVDGVLADLREEDLLLLAIVTSDVEDIDATIDTVCEEARALGVLGETEWMVATAREEHNDLVHALSEENLSAVMSVPWQLSLLADQARASMLRRLRAAGIDEGEIHTLLGSEATAGPGGPVFGRLAHTDEDVVGELLAAVERVLGPRPRLRLPAGVDLSRQGEPVRAVHLVLDGHVALQRDSEHGKVLLHHATTGPLIGLVSLARGRVAFFTSTTTTPTTVVRLTDEQLQLTLAHEPGMAAVLAVLAIQSLTKRLVRAEHLHVEKDQLAADLENERARLSDTLEELRRTRAQLVENTRFAMLGELSAGIAHELNNPVTALARAAEHLAGDVEALLTLAGGGIAEAARTSMRSALEAEPVSTAVERGLIRTLMDAAGADRATARRLVNAGVHDPGRARALLSGAPRAFEAVEGGARIGQALRSVGAASERVVGLASSLKGYARPDAEELRPTDVAAGVEDVLRLVGHRLRGIEVERTWEEAPRVWTHPAKLQQVWTNLLVNAAEAIEDERTDLPDGALPARGAEPARIRVRVSGEADGVLVKVEDNGPGIAPEVVKRMFEPHFTTKAGRVRYGLGMGMSISRAIVHEFGGRIEVDSRPGRTHFSVHLPAGNDAPSDGETGEDAHDAPAPLTTTGPTPPSLADTEE